MLSEPPYGNGYELTRELKAESVKKSRIIGVGHYVPENIVTNADLEKVMNTTDEWIVERTGIEERRWFDPEKDTVSNMATKACKMAL
ncbi:MAG: 3-oxoacyl-[acyl-carrier-protein] synthase-3, partial [Roseivirga sp.]